jgi:hypothetical protein
MHADWVRSIRSRCVRAGAAFFFKQWGGARKSRAGRELDGRTWDDLPAVAPAAVPPRAERERRLAAHIGFHATFARS